MIELLKNYVAGQWVAGNGAGTELVDPIDSSPLVRVSRDGIDLANAFDFARTQGGNALRALTYRQRASQLASVVKVLQQHRDDYHAIAMANSGTTRSDSAIDIDGGIHTLSYYTRLGDALGSVRALRDGAATSLSKDQSFRVQHLLTPTPGVALFINAFNFPSWGLWEKAAPALLSGVPVIVKPATATAWLTHRMVHDVVTADILPAGALSIMCGSSAGLLDPVKPFDVVSFTGSAKTAEALRAHRAFTHGGARLNVEADSLNGAILALDATPGTVAFDLFIDEVVREMTVKSGQKCTAIRRGFVPARYLDAALEALCAKLSAITVVNPRNDAVRMGALVNREQADHVRQGIKLLRAEARTAFDGSTIPLIDADPDVSACVGPHLLVVDEPERTSALHSVEVFGPVATLAPYHPDPHAGAVREANAIALAQRAQGSLVASVFSNDESRLSAIATALASTHGRIHAVSPSVAHSQTGHGNVMPMSLHGGPGRAGGGEELGGLRALNFYHRRSAIQASAATLETVSGATGTLAP
jgi:3,4-dehydroadipyl-CoA semialdehyde dehydrogenase